MKESQKKQIRNIVLLLTSAVACAALLAAHMIYHYSPSGRYNAGDALLDPLVAETMSYPDVNPATGKKEQFTFGKILFAYSDSKTRQFKEIAVSEEAYHKFYTSVRSDKSLESVGKEIETLFRVSSPSILTLYVQGESRGSSATTSQVFQVVQFAPQSDYYRIQLLGSQKGEWAYFQHSHLYQDTLDLFTRS